MGQRDWTVEEANSKLEKLTVLLGDLKEAFAVVAGHQEQIRTLGSTNGGDSHAADWMAATDRISECLRAIQQEDVILRDPERGMIDFPAERDGVPIFLCWKLGEPSVGYWHTRSEGFANRKPL